MFKSFGLEILRNFKYFPFRKIECFSNTIHVRAVSPLHSHQKSLKLKLNVRKKVSAVGKWLILSCMLIVCQEARNAASQFVCLSNGMLSVVNEASQNIACNGKKIEKQRATYQSPEKERAREREK